MSNKRTFATVFADTAAAEMDGTAALQRRLHQGRLCVHRLPPRRWPRSCAKVCCASGLLATQGVTRAPAGVMEALLHPLPLRCPHTPGAQVRCRLALTAATAHARPTGETVQVGGASVPLRAHTALLGDDGAPAALVARCNTPLLMHLAAVVAPASLRRQLSCTHTGEYDLQPALALVNVRQSLEAGRFTPTVADRESGAVATSQSMTPRTKKTVKSGAVRKNGPPPASAVAASPPCCAAAAPLRPKDAEVVGVRGLQELGMAHVASRRRREARLGCTREQRHGREHSWGSSPARRLNGEPAVGASPHTAARRTRRRRRPPRGA